MTDAEPELPPGIPSIIDTDSVAFRSKDTYGNVKRYIHLGNVERKRLGEIVHTHLIAHNSGSTDEFEFWVRIQKTLMGHLDDL